MLRRLLQIKKHHPDKNQGDEKSHNKFIELSKAYEVLSDEQKRKVYDREGEEGLKRREQGNGFDNDSHDPFDIFAQFFGGNPFNRQRRNTKPKGKTINIELHVGLGELYSGKEVDIDVSKMKLCTKCHGSGAKSEDDIETCQVCGGSGVKVVKRVLAPGFIQQMQSTCNSCGGKGKTITHKCDKCGGNKILRSPDQLSLDIPKGASEGMKIVQEGEGHQHPDYENGDVVFTLRQIPHKLFVRKNDDLYMDFKINLLESLTGFSKSFEHLDGRVHKLEHDDPIPPNYVQKIDNLGMPTYNDPNKYGNLYVRYLVQYPKTVDADFKDGNVIHFF
ncbi:DnaJ-like protein [Zancudomyces culisetae]|uniref:DnaJ-like protein n=1 Tax=Zancudomyces culisetae TaxID=1213189 RepID=A0A1R1PPA6_ZANCU|nr:DnaJ-like protein [Zancudomyces culisetae]|eukprot:OMH82816.1 DnaJ-like protein [Zancudomyces culisetae]